MYLSQSTPSGLFNKVQFDIRMYFCTRGAENMHMMSKTTFSLKTDPESGLQYITKSADELTKNHRGNDKENTTGSMPEIPDSPYCPVTSFLKYSQKLHPACDRLWQRPKDTFCEDDDTWYCNVPVGEKKLKSFLPDLSVACKLTQRYTNHSIRATCATILSRGKYNYAQIKAVTGHKSAQSLSIYQKVNDKEKLQMGQAISQSLTLQPSLPPSPKRQALEYQYGHEYTSSTDIANKSTMPGLEGVDVEKLFSDFDSCEASTSVRTCTAYAMPTSSNPYVFNNCSVQSSRI
ncbi:hypothetical protein FSP39_018694 [Pinctada imbricata]|uniref:Tyr recombinase domain-containing protein n=1 Tax=Pinctada imbricata TaxID=66713 RepID=A0AA88XKU4_PINIB|nr:hypothetical protein FSP39_018694 [Pinctada imbricata]